MLVFAPAVAPAQSYPSRVVRMIVAYPPGGSIDAVGGTPGHFAALIRQSIAKYVKIVKVAGIPPHQAPQ